MSRCKSLTEHSWAWISPDGKFHEVENHPHWAVKHPGVRSRAIDRMVKSYRLDQMTSDRGFRVVLGEDPAYIKVSGPVFDDMISSLKNMSGWSSPRGTDEERRAWAEIIDCYESTWEDLVNETLLEEGWMKVSNPNSLQVYEPESADSDMWDTFFKRAYECLKNEPAIAEIAFYGYRKNDKLPQKSWGDALEAYASRDVVEEIFADMLTKARRRLATVRVVNAVLRGRRRGC